MNNTLLALVFGLGLGLSGAVCQAAVTVVDDGGNKVTLDHPAQRVVSMAPHVTEMLFAAGAGAQVVGAIEYSDYPEAAKRIARVGDASQIDVERVLALKPDLIIAWQSGNTARQLRQLRELGIPIFMSEPAKLDDVATSLERFGQLLGSAATARSAAGAFRARIAQLAARYGKRAPVRVFYQIWDQPLYTLSASHIASDVIRLCGGENVFGQLKTKAPQVSVEAVLQADPEVILGGARRAPEEGGLAMWASYPSLLAVKRGNLFTVDGEWLTRAGPRMADGASAVCEKLEQARQRRK